MSSLSATSDLYRLALWTPQQMAQADHASAELGVTGTALMQRAGQAVALAITRRWQPCRVAVLCGPGHNGGDGFIAAHVLQNQGWAVQVFCLLPVPELKGDAAWAVAQWGGVVHAAPAFAASDFDLVVDAVLGAGLNRNVSGQAAQWIAQCHACAVPVCAVDVPSGLHGGTGQVLGSAFQAALTVTFVQAKPGHYLQPGRGLCGELMVMDIGMPDAAWSSVACAAWLNAPPVWQPQWPTPSASDHKYKRGHVLVVGGAVLTGAARLAAQAAQRVGAGLVTLAVPESVWHVYAQALQGCMVQAFASSPELREALQEPRRNVCLIGPGAGVHEGTRQAVLDTLQAGKHLVLDADALSVFSDAPESLCAALAASPGQAVLTPHDGEFARLFGAPQNEGVVDQCTKARRAAQQAQAIVILKGSDTVIAAPDGRVVINANAPATLATGGTGDVLAGMTAGLMAQGMPAFEAACAAVWVHGATAQMLGASLVADDLLEALPLLLRAQKTWLPKDGR